MHIAIRTTGRMVVTSAIGAPSQPIAPRVQISTISVSSIGIITPPGVPSIA